MKAKLFVLMASLSIAAASMASAKETVVAAQLSDLKIENKFGIEYVTGMLDRKVSFACIQSKRYKDQVMCSFFPSSKAPGLQDEVLKMFKRNEEAGTKLLM